MTEENATTQAPAKRELTKVELKRMKIYQERRLRKINEGVDPKKVDAVLSEEDYRNMSLEEKFEQHRKITIASIRRIAQDLLDLQHNDRVIGDAIDINFRAFARMLTKAGVSLEDQGIIFKEIRAEVEAELAAKALERQQAAQAAVQQKMQETEKTAVDALNQAEGKPSLTPDAPPTETAPVPEGATTFGG